MSSPAAMSSPPDNADKSLDSEAGKTTRRKKLRHDLFSSYLLAAVRVFSNAIVIAVLYRWTDTRFVAAYAIIRAALWPLNYVFSAINPALQRQLATHAAIPEAQVSLEKPPPSHPALEYASGRYPFRAPPGEVSVLYSTASMISAAMFVPALVLIGVYASSLDHVHRLPTARANGFAFLFGFGLLWRLLSEPASAMLQARGRLATDNQIQIAGELAWTLLLPFCICSLYADTLSWIAVAYCCSGVLVTIARLIAVRNTYPLDATAFCVVRWPMLKALLIGAALIAAGQFADFLYAPANVLLIDRLLASTSAASYAPALQFDAGLLLLVGAVSTVMLPRAALAWVRGDRALLRAAYLRASIACLFVLAGAALFVGTFVEPILRLWLGTVPSDAPAITRLVLVHTVIGGAAGVGRAVLLGMGRFKAYTLSALVGGVANVGLALLFVLAFDWGVRGIAIATILSVTIRCAFWMPWYILRSLREHPAPASP